MGILDTVLDAEVFALLVIVVPFVLLCVEVASHAGGS